MTASPCRCSVVLEVCVVQLVPLKWTIAPEFPTAQAWFASRASTSLRPNAVGVAKFVQLVPS
jgi:hypothetical protein